MIDIRLIREEPERVRAAIATLNTTAPIDEIIALDTVRRSLLNDVETMKARRNEGSKQVNKASDNEQRQTLIAEMRTLGEEISALDEKVRDTEAQLNDLMLTVPNL